MSSIEIMQQMELIQKRVKAITPNLSFSFVRTLNANENPNNKDTMPKCPNCNSDFLRLRADTKSCIIRCHNCFWEEYYIRIRKNENI